MLSSILNLPRRLKNGPASQPVTSPESNREEDGFLLLGQSESERNTIMPTAASTCSTIPPPPTYEQVTGTPPSLPPAAADLGYHGYRSPSSNGASSAMPAPTNHLQQTADNRTNSGNTVTNNSQILNKSSNSDWGIIDVPFELSPELRRSNGSSSDYFVVQLPEVDWRQYDYDFQFEEQVKRESEMALEKMEELD